MNDKQKNINFNSKVLTPFKLCVLQNFPYIEADFDALTNYELMCKIVEYLNNTIVEQNNVSASQRELVDYVNNYFKNLDVTEEINEKLDSMASDGSLLSSIKPYIDSFVEDVENSIEEQNTRIVNLNTKVNNIVSGSPAGVYDTLNDLIGDSSADTSKIYVVRDTGNWYYYNGTNWVSGGVYQGTVLDLEPKQFYENNIGNYDLPLNNTNLIISYNKTNGYFISPDGTLTENAKYSVSDFIPIIPGGNLIVNRYTEANFFGFYDINKNFIQRTVNTLTATIPTNAYYLRYAYVTDTENTIEMYLNSSIPNKKYHFTDFIRSIGIVKNIPHAKLMRGSVTITNVDLENRTVTINVANETIVYNENQFTTITPGNYTIPQNNGIFVNSFTKDIETYSIDTTYYTSPKAFNGLYFLGFMNDGYIYTDTHNKDVVVDKNGFMTYAHITDAIKIVTYGFLSNQVIYVKPGEYNETIKAWNIKNLKIYGEDPNTCIIYNDNGNYSNPPIEIAGGIIKNVTIECRRTTNTNITDEWSSYAMHIESNLLANNSLICENVIFKSAFNYCVGLGLRLNANVIFKNCKFINNCSIDTNINPTPGGAIYFHDSNIAQYYGEANLVVDNCYAEIENFEYGIWAYSIHEQNTTNLTFIDNSIWCKSNETQNVIVTTHAVGTGWLNLVNMNLTFPSHGNNINSMNK